MYERMLEGIICLFIPFYDEIKSLVLLFLILTRARVSLMKSSKRVKSNI
jgi:receptor expression-enhancing protein 5/6